MWQKKKGEEKKDEEAKEINEKINLAVIGALANSKGPTITDSNLKYVAEKNTYNTNFPYVNRGGYCDSRFLASYRNVSKGLVNVNASFRLTLYVVGLNS